MKDKEKHDISWEIHQIITSLRLNEYPEKIIIIKIMRKSDTSAGISTHQVDRKKEKELYIPYIKGLPNKIKRILIFCLCPIIQSSPSSTAVNIFLFIYLFFEIYYILWKMKRVIRGFECLYVSGSLGGSSSGCRFQSEQANC